MQPYITSVNAYNEFLDVSTESKYGIDKLDLMVHFMPLLDGEKVDKEYNRFKSFLVSKIRRGITKQEEVYMMEGIVKYVKSDSGTSGRMEAMNYLFNLDFLQ